MIGTLIADRYEVTKELGEGGMATVWVADDRRFNREVAIKVMNESMGDDRIKQRFNQEAQIIAKMEHHAIVPIYDFGETDEGRPYLIMRMMRGGSLEDKLKAGAIDPEDIETIMRRVCAALDKVHVNHVIHRDLKPANILFDEAGMAYLADFGVARLAEGTQTTTIAGTPYYMAPEQIRGLPLSPQTDVYQLGVMLFFLLTGEFPYTGNSSMEIMHNHVNEPVPSVLNIDPSLAPRYESVLTAALAKHEADRPATAGELFERFKREADGLDFGQTFDLPISNGFTAPPAVKSREESGHYTLPQTTPFPAKRRSKTSPHKPCPLKLYRLKPITPHGI